MLNTDTFIKEYLKVIVFVFIILTITSVVLAFTPPFVPGDTNTAGNGRGSILNILKNFLPSPGITTPGYLILVAGGALIALKPEWNIVGLILDSIKSTIEWIIRGITGLLRNIMGGISGGIIGLFRKVSVREFMRNLLRNIMQASNPSLAMFGNNMKFLEFLTNLLPENLRNSFADNFYSEMNFKSFLSYMKEHPGVRDKIITEYLTEQKFSTQEIRLLLADDVEGYLAYTFDEKNKERLQTIINEYLEKHPDLKIKLENGAELTEEGMRDIVKEYFSRHSGKELRVILSKDYMGVLSGEDNAEILWAAIMAHIEKNPGFEEKYLKKKGDSYYLSDDLAPEELQDIVKEYIDERYSALLPFLREYHRKKGGDIYSSKWDMDFDGELNLIEQMAPWITAMAGPFGSLIDTLGPANYFNYPLISSSEHPVLGPLMSWDTLPGLVGVDTGMSDDVSPFDLTVEAATWILVVLKGGQAAKAPKAFELIKGAAYAPKLRLGVYGAELATRAPRTYKTLAYTYKGGKLVVEWPMHTMRLSGRLTAPLLKYAPVRTWGRISHLYTLRAIGSSFFYDAGYNYQDKGILGIPETMAYWYTLGIPHGIYAGIKNRSFWEGYNTTFAPAILHIFTSPVTGHTLDEKIMGVFFWSSAMLGPGSVYNAFNTKSRFTNDFMEMHPEMTKAEISRRLDISLREISSELGVKSKTVLKKHRNLLEADLIGRIGKSDINRPGMKPSGTVESTLVQLNKLDIKTRGELSKWDKICRDLNIDLNAKIKAKYGEGVTTREAAVKAVIVDLKKSMPQLDKLITDLDTDFKDIKKITPYIEQDGAMRKIVDYSSMDNPKSAIFEVQTSGKTSTLAPGAARLLIEKGVADKVFIILPDVNKVGEAIPHADIIKAGKITIDGKSRNIRVEKILETDLRNPQELIRKIGNADVIFAEQPAIGFLHLENLKNPVMKKIWANLKDTRVTFIQDEIHTSKQYVKISTEKRIPLPKNVIKTSLKTFEFITDFMRTEGFIKDGKLDWHALRSEEYTIREGKNFQATQKLKDMYAKYLGLNLKPGETLPSEHLTALGNAVKSINLTDRYFGFMQVKHAFGKLKNVIKPAENSFTQTRKEFSNPWELASNEIYIKERFREKWNLKDLKMSLDDIQTEYFSALADLKSGGKFNVIGLTRTGGIIKHGLKYGLGIGFERIGDPSSIAGKIFTFKLRFPKFKINPESIFTIKTPEDFSNKFSENLRNHKSNHVLGIAADMDVSPLKSKLVKFVKDYTVIFQGKNAGEWIQLDPKTGEYRQLEKGKFNLKTDEFKVDYDKVQNMIVEAEKTGGKKVVIVLHQGGIFGTDIYTTTKTGDFKVRNVEFDILADKHTTLTDFGQDYFRDRGIKLEEIIGRIVNEGGDGFIDINKKIYGKTSKFKILEVYDKTGKVIYDKWAKDVKLQDMSKVLDGTNRKVMVKVKNEIIEGELLKNGEFKATVFEGHPKKVYFLTDADGKIKINTGNGLEVMDGKLTPKKLLKILSLAERDATADFLHRSVGDSGREVMRNLLRAMEIDAKGPKEIKILKKIQADWEATSYLLSESKAIDAEVSIQRTANLMKGFGEKWISNKSLKLLSEKNQIKIKNIAEGDMEIRLPDSVGRVEKGFYQAQTPKEWADLVNKGAPKKLYSEKVMESIGIEGNTPLVDSNLKADKLKLLKDGKLDIHGILSTLTQDAPITFIPNNLPYNAETILATSDSGGFSIGGTLGNLIQGYGDGNDLAFSLEVGRNTVVVTPIISGKNIDMELLDSQIRFLETQFDGRVQFSKPTSVQNLNPGAHIVIGGESTIKDLEMGSSEISYNKDALQYNILKIDKFIESLGQDKAIEFINAENMGLSKALRFINAVGFEKATILVDMAGPVDAINIVNSYMETGSLNDLANAISTMPEENFIQNVNSLTHIGIQPSKVLAAMQDPFLAKIISSKHDFNILQNNLEQFSYALSSRGVLQNTIVDILTTSIETPELLQHLIMEDFSAQEVASLIKQNLPVSLAINASPYVQSMTPHQLWMTQTRLNTAASELNVEVSELTSLLKPVAEGKFSIIQDMKRFSQEARIIPSAVLDAMKQNSEFSDIMMSEGVTQTHLYSNLRKISQVLSPEVVSLLLPDPQFTEAMNSPRFMENPVYQATCDMISEVGTENAATFIKIVTPKVAFTVLESDGALIREMIKSTHIEWTADFFSVATPDIIGFVKEVGVGKVEGLATLVNPESAAVFIGLTTPEVYLQAVNEFGIRDLTYMINEFNPKWTADIVNVRYMGGGENVMPEFATREMVNSLTDKGVITFKNGFTPAEFVRILVGSDLILQDILAVVETQADLGNIKLNDLTPQELVGILSREQTTYVVDGVVSMDSTEASTPEALSGIDATTENWIPTTVELDSTIVNSKWMNEFIDGVGVDTAMDICRRVGAEQIQDIIKLGDLEGVVKIVNQAVADGVDVVYRLSQMKLDFTGDVGVGTAGVVQAVSAALIQPENAGAPSAATGGLTENWVEDKEEQTVGRITNTAEDISMAEDSLTGSQRYTSPAQTEQMDSTFTMESIREAVNDEISKLDDGEWKTICSDETERGIAAIEEVSRPLNDEGIHLLFRLDQRNPGDVRDFNVFFKEKLIPAYKEILHLSDEECAKLRGVNVEFRGGNWMTMHDPVSNKIIVYLDSIASGRDVNQERLMYGYGVLHELTHGVIRALSNSQGVNMISGADYVSEGFAIKCPRLIAGMFRGDPWFNALSRLDESIVFIQEEFGLDSVDESYYAQFRLTDVGSFRSYMSVERRKSDLMPGDLEPCSNVDELRDAGVARLIANLGSQSEEIRQGAHDSLSRISREVETYTGVSEIRGLMEDVKLLCPGMGEGGQVK